MAVSILPINFEQLAALYAQAPELVQREMQTAMNASLAKVHYEVAERTPVGVGFGGHLAGTLSTEITQLDANTIGMVGTNKPYAEAVELGTKPHMPPIAPLVDWAEAVLGLEYGDALAAAWGIAIMIKRFGTEGKFMFRDGFDASETFIRAQFKEAVAQIKQGLSQ